MEYELNLVVILALVGAGLVSGFINTLAGGGSMLSLPALMLVGMPPEIANATNRVAVLLQSLTGSSGFNKQGMLERSAIVPILVPTLLGSLAGALIASYLPSVVLKPVLLTTMVIMALVMLFKPATIVPELGTEPFSLAERPMAWGGMFVAGLYGGFVQAGVGFILLAALAGGLRYDLVRSNALKNVCTAALSVVALGVFVARDQVLWVPGLVLAVGSMSGAYLSVKFAIRASQRTLKWILLVMVLLACGAALMSS
ncbi:sulfite exporter TauE/SafE family protein [Aestuariirhabdus litorea]|uniref:Probable membrane transporter protein n=1 Tax=Aestuariirhabdus litorea TaxID=2528527 RepID=A0A3P3VN73_9GAMM|nr:sulfite exporter TauE/SafE family protein [Aestuariirhabdus litorea]RRJ84060.1 sulfite exporter TauE/SafE family protein [Aestuariirhabdus litorea]RWW97280.1 sulfite exporter TauE/SafE family protein [Endozoicomonadaceae bacterium GTF-13]